MNRGIDVKDADDVVRVCVILERDCDLNINWIYSVTVLILIVEVFFSKRLPFFFHFFDASLLSVSHPCVHDVSL